MEDDWGRFGRDLENRASKGVWQVLLSFHRIIPGGTRAGDPKVEDARRARVKREVG